MNTLNANKQMNKGEEGKECGRMKGKGRKEDEHLCIEGGDRVATTGVEATLNNCFVDRS